MVRLAAIEGNVLDSQGKPVRNALVYTFPMEGATPGPPLREHSYVQVDAQGKYRVFGLRPGRYAIGVSYSDNRPGVGSGMLLFPNNASPQPFAASGGEEHHADFSIFSSVLYRLKGAAETSSTAVFGVTLVATGLRSVALVQKQTGPGGTFEFEGVPSGSYDILVSGPTKGYGFRSVVLDSNPTFGRLHIDVGADMENLRIPVSPAKSVTVILKERPEGCPATVNAALSLIEDWGVQGSPNVSASFGKEQSVDGLAPGPYRITAVNLPAGCSATSAAIDLNAKAAVELPFQRTGSISGTLDSAEGEILLVAMDAASTEANQMVQLDSDAHFTIGGLRPGHYRLIVSSGDVSEALEAEVVAGKPLHVDLHMPAKRERQ